MRKESQIFYDLSRGAVHKGQSNRIHQRMEMTILRRCNISFPQIAWFCGFHLRTVKRWIIRIELGEPISDLPRSGRPSIFTQDILLRTIAFYCQTSPLPGCSKWSLRWASEYFEKHPELIGCSMSHSGYWAYSENACLTSSSEEIFPANH